MARHLAALVVAFLLVAGLAACDDEAEIETPGGEVELESD